MNAAQGCRMLGNRRSSRAKCVVKLQRVLMSVVLQRLRRVVVRMRLLRQRHNFLVEKRHRLSIQGYLNRWRLRLEAVLQTRKSFHQRCGQRITTSAFHRWRAMVAFHNTRRLVFTQFLRSRRRRMLLMGLRRWSTQVGKLLHAVCLHSVAAKHKALTSLRRCLRAWKLYFSQTLAWADTVATRCAAMRRYVFF